MPKDIDCGQRRVGTKLTSPNGRPVAHSGKNRVIGLEGREYKHEVRATETDRCGIAACSS
jgi:hypothetical protein